MVICDKCGKILNRDDNIYGTCCPYCDSFIPSENKPVFIEKIESRYAELKEECLNKLRNKLKEKHRCR